MKKKMKNTRWSITLNIEKSSTGQDPRSDQVFSTIVQKDELDSLIWMLPSK